LVENGSVGAVTFLLVAGEEVLGEELIWMVESSNEESFMGRLPVLVQLVE